MLRHVLAERYARLCPYDETTLKKLVNKDLTAIVLVAVCASLSWLVWSLTLGDSTLCYLLGTVGLLFYVVFSEISAGRVTATEECIYLEFVRFLSGVKHAFMESKNVPYAVLEAAEETKKKMRQHAMLIYRILSGGERRERVREYVCDTEYNQYLKLFLVQAYEASEKGDAMVSEEKSLFTENLECLRMLVMEERYRRKKRLHEFAGYTFVSLVPVFAMPIFKNWGLSFSEEMSVYYQGIGKVTELLTLLVTYGIYRFISHAREICFFYDRTREKRWNLRCLQVTEEKLEEQNNRCSQHIRSLLLQTGIRDTYGRFIMRMLFYAMTGMFFFFWFMYAIGIGNWPVCLLWSIAAGIGMGSTPYIQLRYRNYLFKQQTYQEIRQFQSVLLMERKLEEITIPELLEDMEIFSRRFRGILRECINTYSAGPLAALHRLKEQGESLHDGFRELAEGFLAVDSVGVKLAFAEVENDRAMTEKTEQLEAEIKMENRKDGMELLAKIPMILAVGGYFILPFLVISLQGVNEIFHILEELGG